MTSDAALLASAADGDDASFDALHRRHVLSAWGLAQAITRDDVTAETAVRRAIPAVFAAISRGSYPSGLPVRVAVLAAARAAAVAQLHSSTWTGRPASRDLVDRAYSGLPECWRTILWLLEVEGLTAYDAARPLRVQPDEVPGLLRRARDGFTDRYIRLAAAGRPPECRAVLTQLPWASSGWLQPRHVARADQHLADCQPCRQSSIELGSLGPTLRRIALPTPVLPVAPMASRRLVPAVDRRRVVPALAAAAALVFGAGTFSAASWNGANPVEQVASPVEAVDPPRDPGRVGSFSSSSAAGARIGPGGPAPGEPRILAARGRDIAVVSAVRTPADVAATGPDAAPGLPADGRAAPDRSAGGDPGHDGARTAPQAFRGEQPQAPSAAPRAVSPPAPPPPAAAAPAAPAPGDLSGAPEVDGNDDPPPAEVGVGAEVASVSVETEIDPGSAEPLQVDLSAPGPVAGLPTSGSGA